MVERKPLNRVVLIAGPGRSGTTFLWQILRNLGYDVGGKHQHAEFFRHRRGAILRGEVPVPYIVKGTGGMCVNLDERIQTFNLDVEHVIVALRNLDSMIRSQIKMKRNKSIYKGLNDELLYERLKEELPRTIGKLFLHLTNFDIPFTIIKFPLSAQDADYCFDRLRGIFDLDRDKFIEAWEETVIPEKIRFGG